MYYLVTARAATLLCAPVLLCARAGTWLTLAIDLGGVGFRCVCARAPKTGRCFSRLWGRPRAPWLTTLNPKNTAAVTERAALQIFCNTCRFSALPADFLQYSADFPQYLQIFCITCRFSAILCRLLQIFCNTLQIFCNTCRFSATLCRFSALPADFLQYSADCCRFSATLCRFSAIPADFLQHSADFLHYLQIFCNTLQIVADFLQHSADFLHYLQIFCITCRFSAIPADFLQHL